MRTDVELLDRWRELLADGDHSSRSLWITWFAADERQLPVVVPVDGLPEEPDRTLLPGLVALWRAVLEDQAPGGSVGLALSGPTRTDESDIGWLRVLADAARAEGVRLRTPHVGAPAGVRAVAPDLLVG